MLTGSHLIVWRFSVGGTGDLSSGQATRGVTELHHIKESSYLKETHVMNK